MQKKNKNRKRKVKKNIIQHMRHTSIYILLALWLLEAFMFRAPVCLS